MINKSGQSPNHQKLPFSVLQTPQPFILSNSSDLHSRKSSSERLTGGFMSMEACEEKHRRVSSGVKKVRDENTRPGISERSKQSKKVFL